MVAYACFRFCSNALFASLALLLLTNLQPAQACSLKVKPRHSVYSALRLMPTAAGRIDEWDNEVATISDRYLFILLPNHAKLSLQDKNPAPSLISVSEEQIAAIPWIKGEASRSGYHWWRFVAKGAGQSTLKIDTGKQKKTLTVKVKAYVPEYELPTPTPIAVGEATREQPVGIFTGMELEFILPGTLTDDWHHNGTADNGFEFKTRAVVPANRKSEPAQIKLTFTVTNHDRFLDPLHLTITRSKGVGGRKSFDFYFVRRPEPKC